MAGLLVPPRALRLGHRRSRAEEGRGLGEQDPRARGRAHRPLRAGARAKGETRTAGAGDECVGRWQGAGLHGASGMGGMHHGEPRGSGARGASGEGREASSRAAEAGGQQAAVRSQSGARLHAEQSRQPFGARGERHGDEGVACRGRAAPTAEEVRREAAVGEQRQVRALRRGGELHRQSRGHLLLFLLGAGEEYGPPRARSPGRRGGGFLAQVRRAEAAGHRPAASMVHIGRRCSGSVGPVLQCLAQTWKHCRSGELLPAGLQDVGREIELCPHSGLQGQD
mmetsp:Transcript_89842/g.287990  ORF Transcript_89842/g.287990 Transcript_89842/m.287990 type:complete len:282 (+) Transcript_89842:1919-2764(+)